MTLEQIHKELVSKLREAGFEDPAFEARALEQGALNWTSAQLILRAQDELSKEQIAKLFKWVEERAKGMPLAYLAGVRGFYKETFFVEPGVLIPRPETELVIETAKALIDPVRIADFGCGTGCIGLSLLGEFKKSILWSIDSSPVAIALTLKNAEKLGLADRTQVILSDAAVWNAPSPLDLVVANPPYIAEGDSKVERHVHNYEPHAALYSGPDGLVALRGWTKRAFKNLAAGGVFVSEIGASQSASVQEIMFEAGFSEIATARDLAGHDRVVSGRKK